MTGPDRPEPPAPPSASVPDLINDYRTQQDAWRAWEGQLERLRNEILAAAEREAATVVTTARADIRRVLVEARRALLVLGSQVRAATEGQEEREARDDTAPRRGSEAGQWAVGVRGETPGSAASDTQDRLLVARHDVRRVLDDARPDIEWLSQQAEALRQRTQPKVNEEQTLSPAARLAVPVTAPPVEDVRAPAPYQGAALPPAPHGFGGGGRERLSRIGFVTLFTLAAAAILVGVLWWPRPGPASVERGTPQAAAAPAPAVQASEPSRAVDETPPPVETAAPRLSLVIEARREAWIQSTIDGQTDAGRLYQAGDTRTIEGAQSVLLRVGDAGAVHVSVNGKEAEILGEDRRIVTRRYTADAAPAPARPLPGPSSSAERPPASVSRGTR